MKAIIIANLFFVFLSNTCVAGGFSNIAIAPDNANASDTIRLCYQYHTLNRPATIFTKTVSISDTFIHIDICYGMGQQTAGVTLYDTIELGVFHNPAHYHGTLYMYLASNLNDTLCSSSIWYDSAQTSFIIRAPNFINNIIDEKQVVNVYPNPASSSLSIVQSDESLKIESIEVTDLLGRSLLQTNYTKSKIDISALAQGLYLLKVYCNNKFRIAKFIKQ